MYLTEAEIRIILDALRHSHGYSQDPDVARLQTKLSIMLQVKQNMDCDVDGGPVNG